MKRQPTLAVSEPDLQGALAHLRSLSFSPDLPETWDRKWLIDRVREAVGKHPKVGDVAEVAPGVLAQVKPFGVDLAGKGVLDGRLQVWLSIRGWGTDPTKVVEI